MGHSSYHKKIRSLHAYLVLTFKDFDNLHCTTVEIGGIKSHEWGSIVQDCTTYIIMWMVHRYPTLVTYGLTEMAATNTMGITKHGTDELP